LGGAEVIHFRDIHLEELKNFTYCLEYLKTHYSFSLLRFLTGHGNLLQTLRNPWTPTTTQGEDN
jgi:hypothetical protein